ncbi:glycine--tRNA ligase [Kitasatospora griseola]|uniref:glycine--tRNA ligase n=1 Tax=Kitasatospora griseola TaxID=2064 RepID=UPI00342DDD3C
MLSMQEALLELTRYWTERGCLVVQPMNTEVGAGTLNPATFLRVLGPEPWNVCYAEPSVRPDDARYGENPNRLQTHTQFQVILKPEPGNAQELYLESLKAIGVDVAAHDVRFVEDNWASPALGAWGLGWEVWLDGLEITQFTYFQQAGGMNLEPVSVEITYGIERILMALQGKKHFKEIVYAPGVSYGEVFGQGEYELSRYYLDDADVTATRALFDTYEAEAQRMIDARLPVPAHYFVLKCSHAFNVLDARGAVSTTDRARAFGRMRRLAHEVAELWVARREEEGYPLGVAAVPTAPSTVAGEATTAPTAPATFAFELGTEELPSAEVPRLAAALGDLLREELAKTSLEHGEITVDAAPRRLVAVIADVSPREADRDMEVRGPRLQAAYSPDGEPTRALTGFARAQGVELSELRQVSVNGTEHVAATRHIVGRGAAEVLGDLLPTVIGRLRSEKNMRWSAPTVSFSRPVRWLLALLGEHVVPFTWGGLTSGRTTRVHRTAVQPRVDIRSADVLIDQLREHGIIVGRAERRSVITERAVALAAEVGGQPDLVGEQTLVEEITDLIEQPTPLLGSFEQRYLELPDTILTTVMRKHQRYLPVRGADGQLLAHFVAVANGDCDVDRVRAGNEAVLRARYEDAAFFWRADLATPPKEFHQALVKLNFEERLGSMADRSARIARIAEELAEAAGITESDSVTLRSAGELAKFDLASQMVVELSSLAGTMAREYALRAGESAEVAAALYEMELPRQAGDELPSTVPGSLLALADRFDLLAGLFALGAIPTGSSDPFGLRRAALGIVSILRELPAVSKVSISAGLAIATAHQPVAVTEGVLVDGASFVIRRYEQQLLDAGHDYTLVQGVLSLADNPAHADRRLAELAALTGDETFGEVLELMQRVARIVPAGQSAEFDPALLGEPAEISLQQALEAVQGRLAQAPHTLQDFTAAMAGLVEPVARFFDEILVMTEDPKVKAARLGLLATVRDCGDGMADWLKLA